MITRLFCFFSAVLLLVGCSDNFSYRAQRQSPIGYSSMREPAQTQYHLTSLRYDKNDFLLFDTTRVKTSSKITEPEFVAGLDSNNTDSNGLDSTDDSDKKIIALLLEQGRQHYLDALQAQSDGDSVGSASMFEDAIAVLNEASYYPEIDNNQDFNDLLKSVIEDYEKYIASIDTLSPQSSVYVLREKLNLELDKIDISGIKIPRSIIGKTTVPIVINEYVERNVAFFIGKGRHHMERWIYLSGKYFPLLSRIFQEEGVPQEMLFLAMPESGLNPTIRSWAKAVGMWQFMRGTGALYGLKGNYWFDERRDFEKASRAAAQHLKDLYDEYGDWNLVLVAYNAGGGRVNRGIRKSGSVDFWEMRKFLPRETRNYIPQYMAVTLIAMNPEVFGFTNLGKADSLKFESTTVDDCVDLKILADCAETDLEILRDLNPELTQWCTPPNFKGYHLRIPYGKKDVFTANYEKIPEDRKMDFAVHTVRRGETPGSIAKKYGILTSAVLEINHLTKRKKLKTNSTLVIPIRSKEVATVLAAQAE